MATPKKRKSLTRRKRSRAHDKITLPNIVKCDNCKAYKLPHKVCKTCGYYKQKLILAPKEAKE